MHRQQLIDVLGQTRRPARQRISEVRLWFDTIELAGADQAVEHGGMLTRSN